MLPDPTTPALDQLDSVHFVGAGGIGMMALAQYLHHQGFQVSGSDMRPGVDLKRLEAAGIRVMVGHSPSNLGNAQLVVMTSAASDQNVEIMEARRRGLPVVKRAELLGQITDKGSTAAVAGTHGKTTTTALIGHLLRETGVDASVFGGGFIREGDGHLVGPAILGSNDLFVVEADEYDQSFLHLHPTTSVITSLDFDHPDCYPTLKAMEDAYAAFMGQTKRRLIVWGESERLMALTKTSDLPLETFGLHDRDLDWSATSIEIEEKGASFKVNHENRELGRFFTQLSGRHNVLNVLAALATASAFTGIDPVDLRPHVRTFKGVARRLEPKGSVGGISVVDDYAHHPAEIQAALSTLRDQSERVRVIFQPHTFSRTQALLAEFASALSLADEVLLLDVYGAREKPVFGVSSEDLASKMSDANIDVRHFRDPEGAVNHAASSARQGDVIVTMGAGDVTALAGQILLRLEASRTVAAG